MRQAWTPIFSKQLSTCTPSSKHSTSISAKMLSDSIKESLSVELYGQKFTSGTVSSNHETDGQHKRWKILECGINQSIISNQNQSIKNQPLNEPINQTVSLPSACCMVNFLSTWAPLVTVKLDVKHFPTSLWSIPSKSYKLIIVSNWILPLHNYLFKTKNLVRSMTWTLSGKIHLLFLTHLYKWTSYESQWFTYSFLKHARWKVKTAG